MVSCHKFCETPAWCKANKAQSQHHLDRHVIGIVVDGVSDVMTLTSEQIRPVPTMGTASDTHYLLGLETIEDRMLILADIEKLMLRADRGLIDTVTV